MLAMVVNENAGSLTPRGALRLFASKLAPTGKGVACGFYKAIKSPISSSGGSWPGRPEILCHIDLAAGIHPTR
ncbi:hypothetical protein BZ163_10365 [Pseudomonas sp. VI4.1]|nr:hypothetical protein BZ163_10365 [Pseudomonas sp. VI4.1]